MPNGIWDDGREPLSVQRVSYWNHVGRHVQRAFLSASWGGPGCSADLDMSAMPADIEGSVMSKSFFCSARAEVGSLCIV